VKLVRSICILPVLFLLLAGGNALSHSESETLFDQYTLQASAEGEVANDLMVVHLQVQHEDRDTGALAERVNSDMAWALEQLEAFIGIDSKTQNYSTYPKYEHNRIVGWRSSQTLLIQGTDFEVLKEALQKLQSKLQIQQMFFQPLDETRKTVEDALIRTALDNFKRRAEIVQNNMNSQSYRVIQININTGGRQMPRMRMDADSTMARSMESAPAVEGGQSKISVNVSGQIQLQ